MILGALGRPGPPLSDHMDCPPGVSSHSTSPLKHSSPAFVHLLCLHLTLHSGMPRSANSHTALYRPALGMVPGTLTEPMTFGQLNPAIFFLDFSQVRAKLPLTLFGFSLLIQPLPTTRGMPDLWLPSWRSRVTAHPSLWVRTGCTLSSENTTSHRRNALFLISYFPWRFNSLQKQTSAPTLNFLAFKD